MNIYQEMRPWDSRTNANWFL